MNKYQYWLANIKGIGHRKASIIVEAGLTAKTLYMESLEQIKEIDGLTTNDANRIDRSRYSWQLDVEYQKLKEEKINFVTIEEEYYPRRIREITDCPYILYYKGKLPPNRKRTVAIVGSRMCTPYGKHMARELGKICGENHIHVVSGLARGVDTLAQVGALEHGGDTYGIFGSGVNVCYPPENRKLMAAIIEHGGIISEHGPGVSPKGPFFAARNRLISGFSDAVIVVEAKRKSGTLITVDCALEQGKEVYAVPGRVTDPVSEGTNELIRQGATPIVNVQSFKEDFELFHQGEKIRTILPLDLLTQEQQMVYRKLDFDPKSIDQIMSECNLPLRVVIRVLMELEEREIVQEYYKNYFCKEDRQV